jgi:pimeloyl-ACP methyl ester carboxylesterase
MDLIPFDTPDRSNETRTERKRKAIVFIHGLSSDPETFSPFRHIVIERQLCTEWQLFALKYDWYRRIVDNGQCCAKLIAERLADYDDVALIGHSMGGLIARAAVLSRNMPFVKIVFLIATPNQGAFVNAQLSLLLQLTRATTGKLVSFSHRRGLPGLTQVTKEMSQLQTNAAYARHIDYVSMPGLFFNRSRGKWDLVTLLRQDKAIGAFTLIRELLGYWLDPLKVELTIPHDGVVEELSNSLAVMGPELWSEKLDDVNEIIPSAPPPTYAHVVHEAFADLSHCIIHRDLATVELICDILKAGSLAAWLHALHSLSGRHLRYIQPPSAIRRTRAKRIILEPGQSLSDVVSQR